MDDPALLCYTSGTTGAPKGAVLAHGNLLASAEALLLAWRWTQEDRLVLALPLFHIHGLGVELRLAGGDHGEVLLRGPNVFSGYWENQAATAEAFDDGGWFRTGDLGSFDERGYLRIEGPSKELIITGGFNVHPREVEELLLEHPGVAEVAVVGTPSEEWGEQVTAYVVPADVAVPPDREELLAFAADRLAGFKRPRLVHYVDALPRNALGKVMKHQLRA